MILGIGMDVVNIPTMASQLADEASVFVDETFTQGERRTSNDRSSSSPVRHLAVRFAAKEAFIKAWSMSNYGRAPMMAHINMQHIEVVNDAFHRPKIQLHGQIAEAIEKLGEVDIFLSLSHDGDVAAAMVVLERSG